MQKLGIDTAIGDLIRRAWSSIVGQGYDGVGNVSGKACGVQARIATPVNHSLNLPIVHTTKVRDVGTVYKQSKNL